jgi:hypothetical protein
LDRLWSGGGEQGSSLPAPVIVGLILLAALILLGLGFFLGQVLF